LSGRREDDDRSVWRGVRAGFGSPSRGTSRDHADAVPLPRAGRQRGNPAGPAVAGSGRRPRGIRGEAPRTMIGADVRPSCAGRLGPLLQSLSRSPKPRRDTRALPRSRSVFIASMRFGGQFIAGWRITVPWFSISSLVPAVADGRKRKGGVATAGRSTRRTLAVDGEFAMRSGDARCRSRLVRQPWPRGGLSRQENGSP